MGWHWHGPWVFPPRTFCPRFFASLPMPLHSTKIDLKNPLSEGGTATAQNVVWILRSLHTKPYFYMYSIKPALFLIRILIRIGDVVFSCVSAVNADSDPGRPIWPKRKGRIIFFSLKSSLDSWCLVLKSDSHFYVFYEEMRFFKINTLSIYNFFLLNLCLKEHWSGSGSGPDSTKPGS
jgi:hypothetical protein